VERKTNILCYDIETSPIIGYTWGVWQTDVIQIKEDWQILSVAWKWVGEKKVHCLGQDDFPDYKPGVNNDFELVKKIHELFDKADVVIAHNGNRFDQPKCQARMMIHGLKPPSPYKQLDTKIIAKRYASFTRNNLKWLAKDLKVNQKGDPGGFETWEGCLAGDPKSWAKMKKYNKQDIPPLEDIYLKLRPWVTNHPNMARIGDRPDACPKCGANNSRKKEGCSYTTVGKKQQYSCTKCGGWCTDRTPLKTNEDTRPSYVNQVN
jgi:hypothetical protein